MKAAQVARIGRRMHGPEPITKARQAGYVKDLYRALFLVAIVVIFTAMATPLFF